MRRGAHAAAPTMAASDHALTTLPQDHIIRPMNYSDTKLSTIRTEDTDDETLVEAGVRLLPVIGRALYSAITEIGRTHGLTPAQVKVLLHLGTHRQMTIGEIAAVLDCSMPAASELVDRLVDAGHLTRATDPTDRRRVLIRATPESARISAQLRALREAQIRRALGHLAPEDRPLFISSLEALVAGLIPEVDDTEPRHPTPNALTPQGTG